MSTERKGKMLELGADRLADALLELAGRDNIGRFRTKLVAHLFVAYAARCADKQRLGDLVFKMIQCDDYGVRDVLIGCARDYLTEPVMRVMVARLQELAAEEPDEFRKRHWPHNVESLARQLKDAPLFEAARLASWGRLSCRN
ncbi:MAG: hypothetical protein A2075_07045 [Geobacteraceae bacterium GWC2_58_44]|nr:MAG: hypothetical protein A2075_07045 [Geobacteraceae bacterium GWC2_58_44]